MKYRKFPGSEFKLSLLGFGTAPIGLSKYQDGSYDQKENEYESIKALEKALELGVNFFETAPVYGNKVSGNRWPKDRASERMLGKVLSSVDREKVFISTKTQAGMNSPKDIIDSFQESTKLLGTEYIDLYQIHGQSFRADNWKSLVTDDALKVLRDLKRDGRIKHIGVSGYREGAFCSMIDAGIVDAIMPQYNIFYRSAEWELLDLAKDNNVAVFPMRPATGMEIVKFFKECCEIANLKIDPFKIAIEYVLKSPSITSIPIGMRNVKEVEHNVSIINSLSDDILGSCGCEE